MTTVFLGAAVAVLLAMNAMFVVGMYTRDNSRMDIAYGPVLAWVGFAAWLAGGMPDHFRPLVMLGLACLWGGRLGLHIGLRHRGRGEDFRYRNFRESWGETFVWRSFLQIYMLQGAVILVVAAPILFAVDQPGGGPAWSDALGLSLFALGFFFEAVGDWQLARFKKNPDNRGRVMTRGLWRYTRHPNYFGEATVWWGFFFLGLASPLGLWGVVSPLLISFLLLKVSGIPMLEARYEGNPEFEAYRRATSAFFPRPPRSTSSSDVTPEPGGAP